MNTAAEPIGAAVRLLIADDHELYRRGLQTILSLDDRIDVVGEAGDGEEAVERAVELAPDVVAMDVRMPRLSGIEACSAIRTQVPSTRILILTMSEDEADLFAAIKAGANGYVLKDVPGEEIADGILAVHAGQSLIPPSMASQLLNEFAELSRLAESGPNPGTPRLTEREIEVLRLVARGLHNRDIARELFIAENTVKNHVRNILEKLQMHSRTEAALYAVRERLVDNIE
ncbi:MAG: response regulator [Nostocoides sp.]